MRHANLEYSMSVGKLKAIPGKKTSFSKLQFQVDGVNEIAPGGISNH